MTNTRALSNRLDKLIEESLNVTNLDKKTQTRINENIKKTTIEDTKKALKLINFNAGQRISISYLYIYAEKVKPVIVFNSMQEYSFHTITQQEIEQRIRNNRETGLNDVWNHVNRLTEYNEFTRRADQLIEYLEAGKIDIPNEVTYGELLYEILGTTGQLLEPLGINPEKNVTQILLNRKIQEIQTLYKILEFPKEKSEN